MKFEKILNREAVPEWRQLYLNYHLLKEHLKKIPFKQSRPDIESNFMTDLESELRKVNAFLSHKSKYLIHQFHPDLMKKRDFVNLYTEILLLKSFRNLNSTALIKILKKYTKVTGKPPEKPFAIQSSSDLNALASEIEASFASKYTDSNRHRAMQKLRSQNFLKIFTFHSVAFSAGFLWSAYLQLSIANFILIRHDFNLIVRFVALQGPFISSLLFLVNVLVFKARFINWRLVFQLNRRSALHECQAALLIGFLAFVFSISTFIMLLRNSLNPSFIIPLLICCCCLLNPLPLLFPETRLWLLKVIARVVTAPLCSVHFKDFFMNDLLISQTLLFQGISFEFKNDRFAILSPIIPYIPRILQCLRRYHDTRTTMNIWNALKYSFSAFVILLKFFESKSWSCKTIIIIFQVISSLYSLYWDLKFDFGMLKPTRNIKMFLLRDQLVVFPHKVFYYYTIIFDTLARFVWILPIIYSFKCDILATGLIEIIRRFQWTFLRVEYEHLNNCNAFRAVDVDPQSADLFYIDFITESSNYEAENEGTHESDDQEMEKFDDL